MTYSGRREECIDEMKTLREIKPFRNILKFSKKTKDAGHYQFRQHVGEREREREINDAMVHPRNISVVLFTGKLIGKNLSDFEDLRNTEVNEFRWKMKVFANAIAQERRKKL